MATNSWIRVDQVHDKSRDSIVFILQSLNQILDTLRIILIEFLDALVSGLEECVIKLDQNRSLLAQLAPDFTLSGIFRLFRSWKPFEVFAIPVGNSSSNLSTGINHGLSEVDLRNLNELILDQIGVSSIKTVLRVNMEVSPHAGIQPSANIILRLIEREENHANVIDFPAEDFTTTNNLNSGEAPNEEWLDGEGESGQDPEPWDVQAEVIHEAESKVLVRLSEHGK